MNNVLEAISPAWRCRSGLALCLIALVLFCFPSCTTAELTAGLTAATATAAGLVKAISPLLSPEDAAKLTMVASKIDGGMEATQTAVSAIADVIGALRTKTEAGFAQHATSLMDQLNKLTNLSATVANGPSREEVYGAGAGSVGLSRYLSYVKHRPIQAALTGAARSAGHGPATGTGQPS